VKSFARSRFEISDAREIPYSESRTRRDRLPNVFLNFVSPTRIYISEVTKNRQLSPQ